MYGVITASLVFPCKARYKYFGTGEKLSAIQTRQQNIELKQSGWPEMKSPIEIRLVNIKKMRLDAKSGGLEGTDKNQS